MPLRRSLKTGDGPLPGGGTLSDLGGTVTDVGGTFNGPNVSLAGTKRSTLQGSQPNLSNTNLRPERKSIGLTSAKTVATAPVDPEKTEKRFRRTVLSPPQAQVQPVEDDDGDAGSSDGETDLAATFHTGRPGGPGQGKKATFSNGATGGELSVEVSKLVEQAQSALARMDSTLSNKSKLSESPIATALGLSGTEKRLKDAQGWSVKGSTSGSLGGDAEEVVHKMVIDVPLGQEIGILWEHDQAGGPLWCRAVRGQAADAGFPVGAVLVRLDGQDATCSTQAGRIAAAWRRRGATSIELEYVCPPSLANPPPPDLDRTHSLGELEHDYGEAEEEEEEEEVHLVHRPPPLPEPEGVIKTPPYPSPPEPQEPQGGWWAAEESERMYHPHDPSRPVFRGAVRAPRIDPVDQELAAVLAELQGPQSQLTRLQPRPTELRGYTVPDSIHVAPPRQMKTPL
eukprot:Hpha_TRINITY_DN3645_c0_g1::TRINITY_DN3645_c0_g1_i1::g.1075::m.1075